MDTKVNSSGQRLRLEMMTDREKRDSCFCSMTKQPQNLSYFCEAVKSNVLYITHSINLSGWRYSLSHLAAKKYYLLSAGNNE